MNSIETHGKIPVNRCRYRGVLKWLGSPKLWDTMGFNMDMVELQETPIWMSCHGQDLQVRCFFCCVLKRPVRSSRWAGVASTAMARFHGDKKEVWRCSPCQRKPLSYLNPEFEFNIEKDYLSVFAKVKMVQELFDFFDLDKDGYWNFSESWECRQSCKIMQASVMVADGGFVNGLVFLEPKRI